MALRLSKSLSYDDRYTVWVRVVERIYTEQVDQGWRHQMFRLVRAVFSNNINLSNQGGFLFNWMAYNYVDTSLMLIRRELDKKAGTENLRNLLEDIIAYPNVLTRSRYIAQWHPRTHGEDHLANKSFDKFDPVKVPGLIDSDYIDPKAVRADLEWVISKGDNLRTYAQETRAHRTPGTTEQGIDRLFTFRDLHKAVVDIRKIVEKYYALLTLKSVTGWEPVAQYNRITPFTKAWVTDVDAVSQAIKEELEE